jgi:general L-amino acid transport system permease protein
MANSGFVRNEMLPPQKPPVGERGVVKWLRENLFSSPFNALLTLVGLWAVYTLLAAAVPWLMNGVWNAGSMDECRSIIAAAAGEGASGPCWAVLRERWHQFIFGFFDREAYWRPMLAFALLFVALAPVLFHGLRRPSAILVGGAGALLVLALWGVGTDGWHLVLAFGVMAGLTAVAWAAPKRLVWVTLAFPATAFYLLWGGSIWLPVGAMLGFVLAGGVWWALQDKIGVMPAATVAAVSALLWWVFAQSVVMGALQSIAPIGLPYEDSDKFGGFLLSFVIGVSAISASLPLGILLALGRRSDMFLVKTLSVGFIEFVRGVPLITMLFTASLLLQYFLPPRTNFDLILRVIILVSLFASAYIAEVIRGGMASLPRGQQEAADALGLDYWQAQRLIIMPQALKVAIPGIVSTFISLFKDTTLVALVGLADPLQGITRVVRADINWKAVYWEPFIFVGAIFFLFCFSMSRYSMYLENKLKTDHR